VTHTLVDGRTFSKSSAFVGRVALQSVAYDLLIGVLAESAIPATTINTLEVGAVTCDGFGNITSINITSAEATACTSGLVPLFITDVMFAYTDQSLTLISPNPTDNVTGLPATLAESIPNYFRVASAVILMDLGIWNNNSILVSPDIFNATISPNTAITNFLQNTASLAAIWGFVSHASLLRTEEAAFTVPPESRTPAVVAISYVCHDQRRKGALSFIICKWFHLLRVYTSLNFNYLAIIVANASMFSAVWGVFKGIAEYFAQRYSKVQKPFDGQPYSSVDDSDPHAIDDSD